MSTVDGPNNTLLVIYKPGSRCEAERDLTNQPADIC